MGKYKTTIHQFAIISGIRRDSSDRLTVVTPGSLFTPEARKGQLLIITESTDELARGRDACQLVAKTISKVFYDDRSFSVTSSLRKALGEANSALYQYNFRASPHQKTAVGVSCAVLRGNDLYLAQVQPTQAYIAHGGRLRALPTHPAWNPANIGTAAPFLPPNALGTSLFTEPDLRRNPIGPGDTIVFCSTNLGRLLGREEAERLFCYGDAASALETLYTMCKRTALPDACVIIVELLPLLSNEARDAPFSASGVGERSKIVVKSLGGWLAGLTGDAALLLRRSGRQREAQEAEPEGVDVPEPAPELVEVAPAAGEAQHAPAAGEHQRPLAMRSVEEADEEPLPVSALLGERLMQQPVQQKRAPIDLSDHVPLPVDFAAIPKKQPLPPPSLAERLTLPFRAMLGLFVTFFAFLLRRNRRPAMDDLPRFTTEHGGLSYRRKRQKLPWLPLLLLLSIVALAVLYGKLKLLETQQRNADEALLRAAAALEAAERAPTDKEALALIKEVHQALSTAMETGIITNTDLQRWPKYTNLLDQAGKIERAIIKLNPLSDLQIVATLPPTDTISRVAVDPNTGDIYALGEQSRIIYKIKAESRQIEHFFKEGARAQQITAGAPETFVWRLDAIAPIDRRIDSSTVYLYNPAEPENWLYNTLDGSYIWQREAIDAESFGGNLYIWGAEPGQVLKYTSGAYSSLPLAWISDDGGRDLTSAIDMAVDGKIYLLFPSGDIAVLEQGVFARLFRAPAMEPEIGVITQMFVSGEAPNQGSLYLIEPAAERIIQINKETGELIQQIRAPEKGPPLNQLRDIFVLENANRRPVIYLANGNQILRATVPTPPEPRRPTTRQPTPTTTP
ncbi:MAG: hypothetical protein KatS3mg057_1762 [Herpetosiphonaceae bacterium]|nr:MAG: hypothetical protein KatS3mg057_1762 [Herpetosiphonaceae bacterium]